MGWDAISKAIDIAEERFPTMDISTVPGSIIIFKYPDNGSGYDSEQSVKRLICNGKYTVKKVWIGQSRSFVELEEKPGFKFNTVHFTNIEED